MNMAGKPPKKLQDRRKDMRLTMLYKIINEITIVTNKEMLISADTSAKSKHFS